MPFAPGQVVTVFRSRLRPDSLEEYAETAARMDELARAMPGYVDHKGFTAEDGERVTVVTFADRASHDAWRTHLEHRLAQRRGREAFYETYTLQVADVTDVRALRPRLR
jgi:heme-degrading monooxygenase HmoA